MSVRKEVSSMEEVTCSSGNASEQFMVSNWVPAHVMDGLSSYNVGTSNTSTIEGLRGPPCFGSECLSEIMSSFNLPENTQVTSLLCPQDFPPNNEHTAEKTLKGKKRKKLPDNQNTEAEQEKDITTETMKSPMEMEMEMEMVEKKHKNEGNPGGIEISSDATKEDYIHVRAKRGQATNSHSLAERVRREKISERMKLLQDLVPGCNKITGKAVMLDEIINYVQSLQRQVEFLSMKLAAVNPELNMDIEQIYTKENYHSRYGASFPETITSHPQLQAGMVIPSLPGNLLRPSSNPQISAMAQISSTWDNDYQNGVQLGFIPNLSHDGMEVNGSMKLEL